MTNCGWEFLSSIQSQDDALVAVGKITDFTNLQAKVFLRTTVLLHWIILYSELRCFRIDAQDNPSCGSN